VLNIYQSPTCGGAPTPSVINGLSWGCDTGRSGSSGSSTVMCTTGAYSPPRNSRLSTFYQGATCASSTAVSAGAVAQSSSSGATGACVQQSASQSVFTTCNATTSTSAIYLSADCSGAVALNSTAPLGCTVGDSGATVVSCTGGASSGSAATTLTAAAAVLLAAASAASAWM